MNVDSIEQKTVFVEAPEADHFQVVEPMALQRSAAIKNRKVEGNVIRERNAWSVIVRGLLVLFLLADAIVIGLLANYYLFAQ